jgi:hypothetical protein
MNTAAYRLMPLAQPTPIVNAILSIASIIALLNGPSAPAGRGARLPIWLTPPKPKLNLPPPHGLGERFPAAGRRQNAGNPRYITEFGVIAPAVPAPGLAAGAGQAIIGSLFDIIQAQSGRHS